MFEELAVAIEEQDDRDAALEAARATLLVAFDRTIMLTDV
jgi:hypothetical protein